MRPSLTMHHVRGVDLALWEWPGDGPPAVYVHATGFHARIWDEVIRRAPGRALAIDLRGHGRSGKPAGPYLWSDFGRDLAELAETLGWRGAVGVGHSMGGHAVTLAAALRPETFSRLLLVDPVIFAPEIYRQPQRRDAAYIAKRRNEWGSPAEMLERFRGRAPFDSWRPEVLRDYCEYGLLPEGDRWVLACPPAVEAELYAASNLPDADIHGMLGRVAAPVTVMRGGIPWKMDRFDLAASPTDPELAGKFVKGEDVLLEGRSHYIPMESPETVAEGIWATYEHESTE
jgi:lipase